MNSSPLAILTGRALPRLTLLLVTLALLATACSKAANTNTANTAAANKNTAVVTTTNTSTTGSTSTPSSGAASTPTAAYKAFLEANRKKDYEAVKRSFSQASLNILTEEAKKRDKTLDEFIKQQTDSSKNDEEVINEKLTGDTATIDLKDKNSTLTLPMVKENGEWKIAYDLFMKQMMEGSKPADSQKEENGDGDK